jgi:hypothetical protein
VVRFPAEEGKVFFSFVTVSGLALGAHPPSYLMSISSCFCVGKAAGNEADYSSECVELYLHYPYVFMAWSLLKHRDFAYFIIHKITALAFQER